MNSQGQRELPNRTGTQQQGPWEKEEIVKGQENVFEVD